ncbi:methyltransferase [Mesorhizobium tianshanense]|uniref:Methyltransferase family protein n=1 Tax=Mesorhizobium tianshanense TaxID=39844 RepID=A0A562N6V1_9HYPH|nr:class I SAM-dependent methyltransferase [Mesorhizobium tianshanense]TWI27919.1 methyltransferase family protein [Mesorhizobium tianshanense]GLS39968.1 methyltransferase [Mesorhizobium tianshanense]
MGFYRNVVLPRLVHHSMTNRELLPYRLRALSAAEGRVLEVGIGSGLNLPLYSAAVREVIGLDPSPQLLTMARHAVGRCACQASLIEGSAEAIPLDSHSVDTVVTTWTLCSIHGAGQALREMRRVLKPGGQLLFVEHGLSSEEPVQRWQDRLTPIWRCLGGGCHLNRPIRTLIEAAGFNIARIETGYAKGPRPMVFMYEGRAVP